MAHNRILFPASGAARTALALRMNAINQQLTQLLLTEKDISSICDIVADIARANDITVNYMGFGSIKASDVDWIVTAHDRMDLWTAEDVLAQEQSFVRLMCEEILDKRTIWYDVNECTWNVNETADSPMPEFEGYLSDAINYLGDNR